MTQLLVIQQVENYQQWKKVFDSSASNRKAASSSGGPVFRDADNPNNVVVLLHFADGEKARRYTQSDDLREAMQEAGVTGQPVVYFLDEVDQPSA